jgi:hypothetical protein
MSLTWRPPLDIRPSFSYITARIISPMKDAAAEANCGGGARGGACGRACNPLPGGPGIMPAGITTGVRGASREVGAAPAVISAALAKHPPSLARIAPRDYTPLGKSRGGTPEGELSPSGQRRTPDGLRRLRKLVCFGAEVGPASSGVPYPFCFWRNGKSEEKTPRPTTPRGSFSSRFALPA